MADVQLATTSSPRPPEGLIPTLVIDALLPGIRATIVEAGDAYNDATQIRTFVRGKLGI